MTPKPSGGEEANHIQYRAVVAEKLGVSRMTLYKWLKSPDDIPYGKYKELEMLGVIHGETYFDVCSNCGGLGLVKMRRESLR